MTIEFQALLVEALKARLDATPPGAPEATSLMDAIAARMTTLGELMAKEGRRDERGPRRDREV